MDGNNEFAVCCCFCAEPLCLEEAVKMQISTENMADERQTLFAHKQCLVNALHSSIPLHPDIADQ